MKRKEFIETYADKSVKKELRNIAIVGYICAGISIIAGPFLFEYNISLVLIIQWLLTLGLLLGFHIGRSKACAVIYLILACIDSICGLIAYGRLTGWIIIIVGISAVKILHKVDKELKKFNESIDHPEI